MAFNEEDRGIAARYLLLDLPQETEEDELYEHFGQYGLLEEVTMKRHPETAEIRASVKFANPTMELRSMMLSRMHEIRGVVVTVQTWKMQKLARPGWKGNNKGGGGSGGKAPARVDYAGEFNAKAAPVFGKGTPMGHGGPGYGPIGGGAPSCGSRYGSPRPMPLDYRGKGGPWDAGRRPGGVGPSTSSGWGPARGPGCGGSYGTGPYPTAGPYGGGKPMGQPYGKPSAAPYAAAGGCAAHRGYGPCAGGKDGGGGKNGDPGWYAAAPAWARPPARQGGSFGPDKGGGKGSAGKGGPFPYEKGSGGKGGPFLHDKDKDITARFLLTGLPPDTEEEDLQNYFSVLGEIEEVTLRSHGDAGEIKSGSVKFLNPTMELRNMMLKEVHEIRDAQIIVQTWKMRKLQRPSYKAPGAKIQRTVPEPSDEQVDEDEWAQLELAAYGKEAVSCDSEDFGAGAGFDAALGGEASKGYRPMSGPATRARPSPFAGKW